MPTPTSEFRSAEVRKLAASSAGSWELETGASGSSLLNRGAREFCAQLALVRRRPAPHFGHWLHQVEPSRAES